MAVERSSIQVWKVPYFSEPIFSVVGKVNSSAAMVATIRNLNHLRLLSMDIFHVL